MSIHNSFKKYNRQDTRSRIYWDSIQEDECVKAISEYSNKTSAYELFSFLCDQILSGHLSDFKQIENQLLSLSDDKRRSFAAIKAFRVLKGARWGFFKDLDPVAYPCMWEKLVIPSRDFSGTGLLKRNMTITSLYCSIIDIHGYTSFCQKAGKNINMLKLLDEVIHNDILSLTQENDVISQRARGDEIILIGSQAGAVLKSVLDIAAYFQKKKIIVPKNKTQSRLGHKLVLPKMEISAGVTGGQKYTPLIITADGDISGQLINSAARLQARANKQASDRTSILISNHVYAALNREKDSSKYTDWDKKIFYWNSGPVSFKGTRIWVYEMVLSEDAQYKKKLKEAMDDLLEALKQELWEGKIFVALLTLISRAAHVQGPFHYNDLRTGEKSSHRDLISKCEEAMILFMSRKQFNKAIDLLVEISGILEGIPQFDGTVREYAREILPKYLILSQTFKSTLEEILDERIEYILPVRIGEIYRKTEKGYHAYKKIREDAINDPELGNRQALWNKGISLHTEDLKLEIYSGKR